MMSITKVGATYTFGVTFADLAEVSSISASDQDNIFVPVLNTDTDAYGLASLQTIASGLGAAPDSASFVTIGTSASLSGERVLTAGTGLSITDGGAGSTVTVAVSDAELTALAGLTSAADKVPYFTGSGTAALADLTTFGRSLIDDTTASAARTTLDAQQHSLNLDAINGLATAADRLSYWTGSGTAALTTFSAFARTLVDDPDAATARTTLGAGDVTGPASAATTGNLASFNGTTGKIIKDSTVTCDGSNSLGNLGNLNLAGYIDFTETTTPATPSANHFRIYPKDKAGTSALYMLNDAGTETEVGSSTAPSAATQAQMEAASSTTVYSSPGRQHYHPAAAKTWAYVTVSGGTPTLQTSYNVASITDTGVGQLTITFTTAFSSANWSSVATSEGITAIPSATHVAGSVRVDNLNGSAVGVDPTHYSFVGFGDHA